MDALALSDAMVGLGMANISKLRYLGVRQLWFLKSDHGEGGIEPLQDH